MRLPLFAGFLFGLVGIGRGDVVTGNDDGSYFSRIDILRYLRERHGLALIRKVLPDI